jgi:knotted carbamoyltransferase YgeW
VPQDDQAHKAEQWLLRARSHLSMAAIVKPAAVLWEDLAFHAQQAAEIAIKAVYHRHGIDFSYTHNIEILLDDLEEAGVSIPDSVLPSTRLTAYATTIRYPDVERVVTESEFQRALQLARSVMDWASAEIGPNSAPHLLKEIPMSPSRIGELAEQITATRTGFYQKDFLQTWQHSVDELRAVLRAAEALEELYKNNISARVFSGGIAVSNFRDQSTRTRFSFASASALLGLQLQELDEGKSQIAHGETVRETANMISFLAEAIGIRDDIFLGEGDKYMAEVSAAVDEGFREGVLPQRPAVINLQSDHDHPTQSMADLMHLQQHFGSLENLKGKKIAMTWAYSPSYGKPLSVPQGIITLMTRFGMDVTLAHPEGYDLIPETLEISERHAKQSGGSFKKTYSMEEAFKDADIVYPKSWAPFNVMKERTRLLRAGENDKLKSLEKEALSNNAKFKNWECTEKMMQPTRGGKALYMHCLPADITGVSCKEGEVAGSVFERYRLDTYREAGHKPFVIAAMILMTRFENPGQILKQLMDRKAPRRGV